MLIMRKNKPATIVGTSLCNIVRRTGQGPRIKGICKTVNKAKTVFSRAFVSLASFSSRGLGLLLRAPTSTVKSSECPLCRGSCRGVISVFGGRSVGCILLGNKGKAVSTYKRVCRIYGSRSVGIIKVPGAVSGSVTVASRSPKCKDTTEFVTTSARRINRSVGSLPVRMYVVRTVKEGTK